MQRPFAAIVTLAAVLSLVEAAPAQEAAPAAEAITDYAADTLSGDWGGLRSRLHRAGYATEFIWKIDALSRGNGNRGDEVMGNLDSKLKIDLERIAGWKDTTAFIHIVGQQGGKFNARHVGSVLGVSNIETPVNATKLFHAWLQKNFADGRFSLLAGLYPIDSEFSVLDSAGVFVQPPYGASAELALSRGPSVFNTSSFGLRAKAVWAEQTLYAQAALLDGVPGDPNDPRGTHVKFAKGDGSFAIAEFGWLPAEHGHAFERTQPDDVPQSPVMVAHERFESLSKYAAGVWRYTAKADDLFAVDGDGNPLRRPSWGTYLLAERTLFRLDGDPLRRLSVFGRYSLTDGRSSQLRDALNLGLNLKGPLAARPDDVFGIAYTRGRNSRAWRDAQEAAGIATTTAEDAVEITYRAQISRKLYVQPLWQRIHHPGGAQSAPNADILGLRLELWL
jgi:porin